MKYLWLMVVTLIITIISLFIEINYPFVSDLLEVNIVDMFLLRYMHLLTGIYFVTFFYLFEANSLDGIVYLLFANLVEILRNVYGCCILSYYELVTYNTGLEYPTNFHPSTVVFFREYAYIPLAIMGIIIVSTVYYILFKMKMPFIYKLMIGVTFTYMFSSHLKIPSTKYSDINTCALIS
jgi:hypothetical protein